MNADERAEIRFKTFETLTCTGTENEWSSFHFSPRMKRKNRSFK